MIQTMQPPRHPKRPNFFAGAIAGGVLLIQVLFVLFWGDSVMRMSGMREVAGGELGVRFGDNIYISEEPAWGLWEKVLMTLYWTYPLWLVFGGVGAYHLLRRGRPVLSVTSTLPAFLPLLAGILAIAMYSMEVRKNSERWFVDCQTKHPGVKGYIVIREADGTVRDAVEWKMRDQ